METSTPSGKLALLRMYLARATSYSSRLNFSQDILLSPFFLYECRSTLLNGRRAAPLRRIRRILAIFRFNSRKCRNRRAIVESPKMRRFTYELPTNAPEKCPCRAVRKPSRWRKWLECAGQNHRRGASLFSRTRRLIRLPAVSLSSSKPSAFSFRPSALLVSAGHLFALAQFG